jgi:glycosyltransferase involved in cell wall biosynthesis
VGPDARIFETDYGVVHRCRSPFLSLGQVMVPGHRPFLVSSVVRFALGERKPRLIHSLGLVWGSVGVAAKERLGPRGPRTETVVSAYTTRDHESRGKAQGLRRLPGVRPSLRAAIERAWTAAVLSAYERRVCRESSRVLVNYESVRRLLVRTHGVGAACRTVRYAAEAAFVHADDEPRPPPPPGVSALRPAAAPMIVAVSRHDPRKGVEILLRALAVLRAMGVAFRACLVGPGHLLSTHRTLAERLDLGSSCVLLGAVPDPYVYLRHAEVFVLPSLQESSGSLALLEALQAGVAVVATSVDGIPEDVTDMDGALLVPPGNVPALVDALRRVLTEPDLRAGLAARGRALYRRRFTAEAFVADIRGVYADLGFHP